ncbi:hypothetical protein E4U41_004525, partial [Claviceps citrina]
ILIHFRSSANPAQPSRLKQTHIPALDALAATHLRDTQSPTISLCGRPLPLLYKMVATLVSPPHCKTVFVLDLDGRFDAASLDCEAADLAHVYVQRPRAQGSSSSSSSSSLSPEQVRGLVAGADDFMLYHDDARGSRHREWWGTLVVGALAAGDVTAGWKGWLRVERSPVPGFAPEAGVDEGWAQRERRERAVEEKGWVASSEWGGFEFAEGRGVL